MRGPLIFLSEKRLCIRVPFVVVFRGKGRIQGLCGENLKGAWQGMSGALLGRGSDVKGDSMAGRGDLRVKEEPGLSVSQMTTQAFPVRSHSAVLEGGVGGLMLSNASTQELEAALALRKERSQRQRDQPEQKKPRLTSLPGFGAPTCEVPEVPNTIEQYDLTGDDDLMLGGEGGLREPKGVAPTLDDARTPVQTSWPFQGSTPGAVHQHGCKASLTVRS